MKRNLLSMAIAVVSVLPSMAQWSEDPSVNNRVSPKGSSNYGYEIKTTDDGLSYLYIHIPDSASNPSLRIQIIDKDGKKVLADEGKVLSAEKNLTFTKVNQSLMVDKEGNAIVAVSDLRYGGECYTIYKVNAKGEVLWSKALNGGVSLGNTALMSMVCSEDGGYVFAYEAYGNNVPVVVSVEKLKADGTDAWDEPLLFKDADGQNDYAYPYLVDAGASQTLLVYAKGTNQDLMATLIDFDGSLVWDEDVTVWQGGFTSNPLHTMMAVTEAPEGGAFVAWMDPDQSTSNYENRLSYVKNDGTYGFSTGEYGTNVSNETLYSRGYPKVYYDKENKAIYCVWQQFSQEHQSYHGLYMQKLSLEGELLWGAEGKAVIPMQDSDTYSYYSIQGAGEGQFAIFYMKLDGWAANGTVGSYMVVYDKDGNVVRTSDNFTTRATNKSKLETSQLIDGKYYLTNFLEGKDVYMQRVYLDGTTDGIKTVNDGNANRQLLRREIYSVNGARLQKLSKGVNILRNIYTDNTVETVKKTIK